MTVSQLKTRFDAILKGLNSSSVNPFSNTVESAYEALVLADVMREYTRIKGTINNITTPSAGSFLNQGPGKFDTNKAFRIDFSNGESFYFAADVEVYGLSAQQQNRPMGIKFEADIVVIAAVHVQDIVKHYGGYPAPQHLDSVYECKFGKFNKGQLRELLGLRRHISMLGGKSFSHSRIHSTTNLYFRRTLNCNPLIPLKMARPNLMAFFDEATESLFDLQQIQI